MKRTFVKAAAIVMYVLALFLLTGFSTQNRNAPKHSLLKKENVVFHTHATGVLHDGSTYVGTVMSEGAITQNGSYVMPTKVSGMALHCMLYLAFPDGTLTLRLNCNMVTFNGTWQLLEGTGAYANKKGQGSLVMPNDVDEILTGVIH